MKEFSDISPAGKDIPVEQTYLPALNLKEYNRHKTFGTFLKERKAYSIIILTVAFVEFLIFKQFYPYPDFFSDSYYYLFGAFAHLDVNIWPIGYSKFLDLFHLVTHSPLALNYFQYMILMVASLYFYYTVVYFFPTGKATRTMLCLALFFNPINWYLSNYVSTDALFVAISLVWIAQLIWIIQRPRAYQVIVQALLFIVAFSFRYNAMYYPLLAALAFGFSKQKIWLKAAGMFLGPALAACFIIWTLNASEQLLGARQFPPILGGWQWANNALYMREHIEVDTNSFPSKETARLDRIARKYFQITPPSERDLAGYVANFFIRQPEAPLKVYLDLNTNPTNQLEEVRAWGKVAPIYGSYGLYLIKRHPIAFARYYLLLNTKNYLFPPLEKLEVYNMGEDSLTRHVARWFDLPSRHVWAVSKTLQGNLLIFYPNFFFVLNLYFLWALWTFQRRRGLLGANLESRSFLIIFMFIIFNAAFSIFANIIVIRYQIFPMIILLSFSMVARDIVTASTPAPSESFRKPPLSSGPDPVHAS